MKRFLLIALLTVVSSCLLPANSLLAGSISASPANPAAGQAVTFQYVAHVTTSVKWDFGDDSIVCKGAKAVFPHTFANPGTYTVRAWDTFCDDGAAPTATKTITVVPEFVIQSAQLLFQDGSTSVTVPKNKRGLRTKVTLQGEGSGRVRVQWLLNGQPFSSQVKNIDFSRQRNITIDSNRDLPTQIPGSSHTVSLRIHEPSSPKVKISDISYGVDRPAFGASADFAISYIELRFKNRSAYMNVEKNRRNFKAYADFKCEGSGTLQVQWLVDGKPFFIQSKSVSFAETVTIDSGRNLPTLVGGSHTVSFRLLSPQTRLEIPVIKYLVGGESAAGTSKYNVDIKFKSYQDNFGKANVFSGITLKGKQGEYLVLNGNVINKGRESIPKGFMQTYIGDKLVASQAIKLIPPGGLIPFNSSIQFPPEVQKSQLKFRFIDKLGGLIQEKQLDMYTGAFKEKQQQISSSLGEVKIISFSLTKPVISTYRHGYTGWSVPAIEVYVHAEGVEKATIRIPGYIYIDRGDGLLATMNYEFSLDAMVLGGQINQRILLPTKYSKHGEEIHYGLRDKDQRHGSPEYKHYSPNSIPITLNVTGKDNQGKIAHETRVIKQIIVSNNNKRVGKPVIKDFHIYYSSKSVLYYVKTIRSYVVEDVIKINTLNFGQEVTNADYMEIRHIKTGQKMTPPYIYKYESDDTDLLNKKNGTSLRPRLPKNFRSWPAGKHTAALSGYYNMDNWLPGAGWYELRAYNSQGVTTARVHVTLVSSIYESLLRNAKKEGCTRTGNAGEVTVRTGGTGKCDVEGRIRFKDGKWHSRRELPEKIRYNVPECKRYKCDPWFECELFDCNPLYGETEIIHRAEGYKMKPQIDVFKVEGTAVAADGERKTLLIAFSDTLTGELKNDTKVMLYTREEGKRKKKNVLFSRTIKAGSKPNLMEYYQSPKATTHYYLRVSNRWGAAEAKISIAMYPAIQPVIEYFKIVEDPSTIKSGDEITFKYKFKHAVGDAEIIDPLRNKVLYRIRPDKGGHLKGAMGHTINATSSFELVLKNRAGETIRSKRVSQKIVNEYWIPKQKPFLPKFHSGITADKQSVKAGESFTLEVQYQAADEAYVYDKSTGKKVATLPSFKPGRIGTGKAKITVPVNMAFDYATYAVKLSNRIGTVKSDFHIDVKQTGKNGFAVLPGITGAASSKTTGKTSFVATPGLIATGERTTLAWDISDAVSAKYYKKGAEKSLQYRIGLEKGGKAKGNTYRTPDTTTEYILEVKDKSGHIYLKTATVTVQKVIDSSLLQKVPSITVLPLISNFSTPNHNINKGDTADFVYKFSKATSGQIVNRHTGQIYRTCYVDAKGGGKGTFTTPALQATTEFELIVKNSKGKSARRSVMLEVSQFTKADGRVKPEVSYFRVKQAQTTKGGKVVLEYKFRYANTAMLYNDANRNNNDSPANKMADTLPITTGYSEGTYDVYPQSDTTYGLKLDNVTGPDIFKRLDVSASVRSSSGKTKGLSPGDFAPGKKGATESIDVDILPKGLIPGTTKPVGSLTPDKKTYEAGEQITLSYSVKNAPVAYIDYSLPDGRGSRYDITLQKGAAQGTLEMTASSAGAQSYASLSAGSNAGVIARFSSYSVKGPKK